MGPYRVVLFVDILFVNKTEMFLMLSLNNRFVYFKTLLSKHNKYIQNKRKQIIQSQRLKNIFTIIKEAFKKIVDWIYGNQHIDLIKYMTDSQVYISNNALQVMNDFMKQELTPDGIQYYQTHHKLFLLDLFPNGNIYDNDSYVFYADWKIEKTPEANPKKLKLSINKPETNLKKIDFNINVNNDEIDDKNHKEATHPGYDLTDDNDNNIEHYGAQHKRINQKQ